MSQARLEHANITVSDVHATAAWMGRVFGWKTRWEGESIYKGYSLHVGSENQYLALYTPPNALGDAPNTYQIRGGLNHLAVVVQNLEATEALVRAENFELGEHFDYEPGRRFYFHDENGIEFEVVEYDKA